MDWLIEMPQSNCPISQSNYSITRLLDYPIQAVGTA